MSNSPANHEIARAVNAVKQYGEGDTAVNALDGASVAFQAGMFTAIMGPSGSGKSTLMQCCAGLDSLTSGQVFVDDLELGGLSNNQLTELRRDKLGFVFQSFNLIPTISAEENIILPMRLGKREVDRKWFGEVISAMGIGERLKHRPSELSGGQQQRVAIARALASQPSIVFADEPTGNLDSTSGAEVLSFLRASVDDLGQTIAMVTHDASAAARADRVVFLVDGRVVQDLQKPTVSSVIDIMAGLGTHS